MSKKVAKTSTVVESKKRSELEVFIAKYHLGGTIEKVAWKYDGNSLTTKFVSETRSLLGTVTWSGFNHPDEFEIGIFQTSKLSKMMGVLGDEINVNIGKENDTTSTLEFTDGTVDVSYKLSELSILPDVPSKAKLPPFNVTMKLEKETIDRFIRGCSALNEVGTFSIKNVDNDNVQLIIGYSTNQSNTIALNLAATTTQRIDSTSFPTAIFKEILVANKEAEDAKLSVSGQGLAMLEFKSGNYKSTYHVVAVQEGV